MSNPYACRTLLLGNYDVNVLEVALRRHGKVSCRRRAQRGCVGRSRSLAATPSPACPLTPSLTTTLPCWMLQELHWCDLRDSSFQQLDLDACMGLILNVQASRLPACGLCTVWRLCRACGTSAPAFH